LDYKKLAAYIVIILIGVGFWAKGRIEDRKQLEEYDRFAGLYSEIAVAAQIHRTHDDRFKFVRDSLTHHYGFTQSEITLFKRKLQGHDEEWNQIWSVISRKTDSLAKYYHAHPIAPQQTETFGPPRSAFH
jgi:hypothetical protein